MIMLASNFAAMIASRDRPDPVVSDEVRRPKSWVINSTLTNGSGREIALWV